MTKTFCDICGMEMLCEPRGCRLAGQVDLCGKPVNVEILAGIPRSNRPGNSSVGDVCPMCVSAAAQKFAAQAMTDYSAAIKGQEAE